MSAFKIITHCLLCCFNTFGLGRWVFYNCLISGANLCLLTVFCYMIIIRKKRELYCFREVNCCKNVVSPLEISGMIFARQNTNQLFFCGFKGREIYKHKHIHKIMAVLFAMILSSRRVIYLLLIWINITYSYIGININK